MAVRFEIRALFALALLYGACSEAGDPQGPDVDRDESRTTRADSGRPSGSRDAGQTSEEDDDTDDEDTDRDADRDPADDEEPDDDEEPADDEEQDEPADEEDPSDDDAPTDDEADACDTLSYESFGEAFMEEYCSTCHAGARPIGGVNLATLDAIKENKDEILKRVVVDKDMPPAQPQPSDDERAELEAWLECGAD